jgi:hypothetical protein
MLVTAAALFSIFVMVVMLVTAAALFSIFVMVVMLVLQFFRYGWGVRVLFIGFRHIFSSCLS